MLPENNTEFAETGHLEILESIRKKYKLDLIDRQTSIRNTVYCLAKNPQNDKFFIKVLGYHKNKINKARFRRTINSNRMASRIDSDIIPKLFEFRAFERDNILWVTSLSAYGGKPISQGMFFEGDDTVIDNFFIERLRHTLEVIQKSPSSSFYCRSQHVSSMIAETFGTSMISTVSEWASAHCDFHWGNILDSGNVVDWDMFSRAPKNFDLASIILFSLSNKRIFERLCREFSDILNNDSGRVAILFAATRILRLMTTKDYSHLKVYEPNIRQAVRMIVES